MEETRDLQVIASSGELTEIRLNGVADTDKVITKGEADLLRPYKVYTALLNQTGTANPVATVLENTIGNIIWTRSIAGYYIGTLASAFTSNKTILNEVPVFNLPAGKYCVLNSTSINTVELSNYFADNILAIIQQDNITNVPIEIKVYD